MLRVLADTSVVVSGLLWPEPPSRVLEAARSSGFPLITSARLVDELHEALDGLTARFLTQGWPDARAVVAYFQSFSVVAVQEDIAAPAVRDRADLPVLAAAVGGRPTSSSPATRTCSCSSRSRASAL